KDELQSTTYLRKCNRDPGVRFCVSTQWLFNLVWSFSTPYNSGYAVGYILAVRHPG
ncbi:hypothetical protein BJX96DRAFT_154071, partial [Aspergillus floccosus]